MSGVVQHLMDNLGIDRREVHRRFAEALESLYPDPERYVRERGWTMTVRSVIHPEIGPAFSASVNGCDALEASQMLDAVRAAICLCEQEADDAG